MNTFKKLLELQEDVKSKIAQFLSNKFNLHDYHNSCEILEINCYGEFQSDCDGDGDNIECLVHICVESEESKKLLYSYIESTNYDLRNCNLRKGIGDSQLEYNFNLTFYDVDILDN